MKSRILVVEDNPADVDLLRRALAEAEVDCELRIVEDGADALALIRSIEQHSADAPDLAVLDLNLPKHGGLEVLEAIRSSSSLAKLPVVVLSSSWSPRERSHIEKLGVGRQIVKPPDLDEFMKIGVEVKALLLESQARGHSAG